MTTARPEATPRRCERCQTELPAGKEAGHCPRCLLALALQPDAAASAPGAAAAPSIGELQPLFPQYELQVLLGRGGMGAVYRARHRKLDRLVALKVLLPDLVRDPAFAERFDREARALALLNHSGIVGVHDYGRAGEHFFLVLEYVDGASLRELLAHGRLTARDVLAFVPQLCDALQYAHDHRVVHRDIKPENILVDQQGRVRIADFGLAKLLGQEVESLRLTQSQQAVGTPLYMAPEQIGAPAAVDHRADLYSLGVVVYEMLTGSLPIGRFEPPSAKAQDARAFDPVVMRSLANDPAQRYQQARDVKHDVEVAATAPPAATAVAPATATARPPVPFAPWTGAAITFALSFVPWLQRAPNTGSSMLHSWHPLGSPYTITAWNGALLGIPLWLPVVLAAAAAVCHTLPRFGRRTPAPLPAVLLAIGALFTVYLWLVTRGDPGLQSEPGLPLLVACLMTWVVLELRRLWRGRAAAATSPQP
ncbi:MAG: serine/threonine protein kinase [Planctomycetes bacterium]|nr:serine/threonine protein kinase [Planctomycetota bacterium]